MTMRLSIISFAGIVRTLVAVGTVSEASMFEARVFAMPRNGVATSSWVSSWSSAWSLASAGIGCGVGCREVVFAWIGPAGLASAGPSPVAGCCVADCPYEAVTLRGRKAFVFAERCAACGICAGACPSSTPFRSVKELVSGIDLPDFTVHDLRSRLQEALPAEEVVFRCAYADPGAGIALRCLAMLPPSFVEYALRNGARRVKAIGCADGECAWRTGLELAAERFAGAREPHLRPNVRYARIGDAYEFALR